MICDDCNTVLDIIYDGIHLVFYKCKKCDNRYYKLKNLEGCE